MMMMMMINPTQIRQFLFLAFENNLCILQFWQLVEETFIFYYVMLCVFFYLLLSNLFIFILLKLKEMQKDPFGALYHHQNQINKTQMGDNICQPLSSSVPAKSSKLEIILYLTSTFAKVCIVNSMSLKWFCQPVFQQWRHNFHSQPPLGIINEREVENASGMSKASSLQIISWRCAILSPSQLLLSLPPPTKTPQSSTWGMEN